jgi:hypothetical protein
MAQKINALIYCLFLYLPDEFVADVGHHATCMLVQSRYLQYPSTHPPPQQ